MRAGMSHQGSGGATVLGPRGASGMSRRHATNAATATTASGTSESGSQRRVSVDSAKARPPALRASGQ